MKKSFVVVFFLSFLCVFSYAQDKEKSLYEQAEEAYDRGDYAKAAELYELNNPNDTWGWNAMMAARCFSLIENNEKALYFLKDAISKDNRIGYSTIMLDPDFDNIRKTELFIELVVTLKQDSVLYAYDIIMDLINKPDSILIYKDAIIEFDFPPSQYVKNYGEYDSISDRIYFNKSIVLEKCTILGNIIVMGYGFSSLIFHQVQSRKGRFSRLWFNNIHVRKFSYSSYNGGVSKIGLVNSQFGSIEIDNQEGLQNISIDNNIIGKVDDFIDMSLDFITESNRPTVLKIGEFGNSYELEIDKFNFKDNTVFGDGENEIAIMATVKTLKIDSNLFHSLLNLNGLNVVNSFKFTDNQINGNISFQNTIFPEFSSQIIWKQLKGDQIVIVKEIPRDQTKSGFICHDCYINKGQKPEKLLRELDYEQLIQSYYKLYKIYKDRGDLESANGCYAEMKDVMGRRLKAVYNRDGGFQNYIQWKLNRLLKTYTNHGTNLALPIVISIYVILAFSVFYFFFPSDWDVSSKSKLLHDFKEFKTKNDKGYFKPFLILISGLFVSLINALTLSLNAFVTLGFGAIPTKGLARYVCIIQGFIGWFLLSIFTVTLINQVLF